MKGKKGGKLLLLVLLFSFFIIVGKYKLLNESQLKRLNEKTIVSKQFRKQQLEENILSLLEKEENKGKIVGLYLLESDFSNKRFLEENKKSTYQKVYRKWAENKEWIQYNKVCKAIWNDLKYFPVPLSSENKKLTVSYIDTWQEKRTYGGERGHEGTDIMAKENVVGVYSIVSMTDGVVTEKGWLEKGGYRIGIRGKSGGYFYYAHLDSYSDIEIGQTIKAGQVIGYMGNTGYGKEGTRGKFPVHLHLGIYFYYKGKEISINPYWILKYLENHKLKYAFS